MMCGEIWWVDFGMPYGSEPGFTRPALVVQNDVLNHSGFNTTIVVPITSNLDKADFEGNVFISKEESGLPKDSVLLGSQIVTVDKSRLKEKAGEVLYSTVQDTIDSIVSILG